MLASTVKHELLGSVNPLGRRIRIGSLAGLMISTGGAWLLLYVVLAEILAALIGLLAGVLPAHRAANLDPIEALRAE